MDPNPINPGHLIVISKRHIPNIYDLTREEFSSLQDALVTAKSLTRDEKIRLYYDKWFDGEYDFAKPEFIKNALDNFDHKVTGLNVGINDGQSAGQTVFHLLIHVIPRYDGDVSNPRGGVRNIFPERGNY